VEAGSIPLEPHVGIGGTLFRKALEGHRTKTVPLFRQAIDVKQWLHSEEKHEPVSGVDIAVAVSLKVLDLDGRLEKQTSGSGLD
jgi:hypothetical protein